MLSQTKIGRSFTPAVFALLAVVLTSASLRAGLIGDDYFQRLVLLGRDYAGTRLDPTLDLYSFVPVQARARMAEVGLLPWWCDPDVHIGLGRPLSALTHLARFWLLGMGLSLVPVCAAFPMDRLLIFAGIGAFGLLAMLLQDVGVWPRAPRPQSWRRRAALVLLGLHLPGAALLLVGRTALLPSFGRFASMAERKSPSGPDVAKQTFIFVNGNDFPVFYAWAIRKAEGRPDAPNRIAQLSSMMTDSVVYREDSQTLLIGPEGGFLLRPIDRILASPARAFTPGEEIPCPDYVASIRSITADGRPRQVAFRFRQALENSDYRWLYWDDDLGLHELRLPRVGESVLVKAVKLEP